MTKQTDDILRKSATGEPGNPGQFGTHEHGAPETSLSGLTEESENDMEGFLASIALRNADGEIVRLRKYRPGNDGNPQMTSEQHFTGRALHDPDPETPAIRIWKDGEPRLTLRYRHGELQDPADGTPAFQAWADGQEQVSMHYSAGKRQDPAPDVPAGFVRLDEIASRSTYFTADVPTKQVDTLNLGLGLPGTPDAQVTLTRLAQ